MTQMTIREGLKKYGTHGRASVMKEIKNLVSRDCLGEVLYESLFTQVGDQSLVGAKREQVILSCHILEYNLLYGLS